MYTTKYTSVQFNALTKCLILSMLSVVFYTKTYEQNINYRFRHYTVDNGLSHTDATSVIQDTKGFIWIGTYSGLNRYDGYNTKVIYNNIEGNKIAYLNRITSMCTTKNSFIWLGTEGGLALFNLTTQLFEKVHVTDSSHLPTTKEPLINVIVCNDILYTVSNKNIYSYRIGLENTLTKISAQLLNTNVPVLDSKKDNMGNIWIVQAGSLLIMNAEKKYKKNISLPSSIAITAIYFDKKNDLYFGNNEGLHLINAIDIYTFIIKNDQNLPQFKKLISFNNEYERPLSLEKDKDNNFWMATQKGLFKINLLDKEIIPFVNSEFSRTSITSNSVNSVFIDKSDCLWVTTFGGGVKCGRFKSKIVSITSKGY